MAYASVNDLMARKDRNTVIDLASDTGSQVDDFEIDPNIEAALDDASGAIESALLVGGQYTVTDLTGLEDNAKATLTRLTCEIAMAYLFDRRPGYQPEAAEKALQRADAILTQFRRGELMFGLPAHIAAGLPSVDGPTVVDYNRLNMLADRTRNYYPQRGTRLPLGR